MIQRLIACCLLPGLLLVGQACSPSFSSAMKRGYIQQEEFSTTLNFLYQQELIFIPVTIGGETYRFLWDTGAVTAISTEVQKKLQFPVIYIGSIRDSQKNRTMADYVSVDEMEIGGVKFTNQTAFVSSFTLHPVLKCLDFDGIIGGNTLRFCNWTLDYQKRQIGLTNIPGPGPQPDDFVASFEADNQFDMEITLMVGGGRARGFKFDTGSNGGVSMPLDIFNKWLTIEKPDTVYKNIGFQQSGMLGRATRQDSYFTFVDSVLYGTFPAINIPVRSGNSPLIGNEVWSQFVLTIDWARRQVYGHKAEEENKFNPTTWGVSLSWDEESQRPYVLQVLEGSRAYQEGVRPPNAVYKIGEMDFTQEATYCDYLAAFVWEAYPEDKVPIVMSDGQGGKVTYELTRVEFGY